MNDQHESWWAHLAPWIAGVAMIIIMFALPTIVWQEYHYNKVSPRLPRPDRPDPQRAHQHAQRG